MNIVYDLIFLIFAVFYLPYFLIKKRYQEGMGMRLGILPQSIIDRLKGKDVIWIQAVSVGEALAIKSLITALSNNFPSYELVISTTTTTGNKIARSIIRDKGTVIYFPFDLSLIVNKAVRGINPRLFISIETEIWPNLIRALYIKKIPMILLNGRISSRSFIGYRMSKILLKGLLNRISLFCMQSQTDSERIKVLGAAHDKVVITGSMKFDITAEDKEAEISNSNNFLKLKNDEKLLVAGSTHRGEEEILLKVYKEIREEFSDLKLLLAPRHIERVKEIEKLVIRYEFYPLRASESKFGDVNKQAEKNNGKLPVLLLDTIGDLKSVYREAEIVFIGGSLVKTGGHNLLEAAIWGKVILFGPHMFNFKDTVKPFVKNNAAYQVKNKQHLKEILKTLLSNPAKRERMGMEAKRIVEERKGSTDKNINLIKSILEEAAKNRG